MINYDDYLPELKALTDEISEKLYALHDQKVEAMEKGLPESVVSEFTEKQRLLLQEESRRRREISRKYGQF